MKSLEKIQHARYFVLMMCVLMLVTGCGANADPVLPTLRPTSTITPTVFTATPTTTPTKTPYPTPTPLPPPTQTPLVTDTPGPSPTALIGATSAKPRTQTATPTRRVAQSGSLAIEYFTTDATSAKPGDSIRVFWSVRGTESIIIYRVKADGARDFTWTGGRTGFLDVATGLNDKDQSRFVLTISDAFTRLEQPLTISLKCTAVPWFFEPAPETCAAGPYAVSPSASQSFEHGLMIWIGAENKIYVLFDDKKQPAWMVYADEFKDGMPDRDASLQPPANLSQPVRGFGLIWRTKNKVRDRLGWARDLETGFEVAYQRDTSTPQAIYLRGRDGIIYGLNSTDSSWKTFIGKDAPPVSVTVPATRPTRTATPKK